jgi:hypothetical protein
MNKEHQMLAHRRLWESIPWVINESASESERAHLEEHLNTCADCRNEYAFHLKLQAGIQDEITAPPDVEASFARLLARIEAESDSSAMTPLVAHTEAMTAVAGQARWMRFLVAAVVVQAIGLAVLGYAALRASSAPTETYEVLSNPSSSPAAAMIRLVPSPEMKVEELQRLLDASGLRIVDSRGGADVLYTLAPKSADPKLGFDARAAISALRKHSQILLVEPISGASQGAD